MKKQLLSTLFLVMINCAAMAGNIVVSLSNPPVQGQVAIALYDATGVNDYETIVRSQRFSLKSTNKYQLHGIPAGDYVLRLYIDENSNSELDANLMGIPVEPVGYSNNYQPKGFPGFEPAIFHLNEKQTLEMEVTTESPISSMGSLGVGLGLQTLRNVYRGADTQTMPVPLITYIGERVQLLGPEIRFELRGTKNLSVAATLSYRFPAYEASDSDFLEGMDDRKGATMLGFMAKAKIKENLAAYLSVKHDVLDTIGGSITNLQLRTENTHGMVEWYAGVGLDWIGSSISMHEFGVSTSESRARRPAYKPGNVTSYQTTLGANINMRSNWRFLLAILVDFYNEEATDSPLVDADQGISVFSSVSYSF